MLEQPKKTLAVLLAVCFLMSVTATAVGAASLQKWTGNDNATDHNGGNNHGDNGNHAKPGDNDNHAKPGDNDNHAKLGDNDNRAKPWDNDGRQKIDAKDDKFTLNSHKNKGNVLNNDNGKDLKVVSISKTTNGGKVTMNSKGIFSYKPAKNFRHHDTIKDSFIYKIKDKNGKTDTAKVSITYKFEKHNNIYSDR